MNWLISNIGIYKFENILNHKIYIGQSTNIGKRYVLHLYDAYMRPDKGTGVDIAIHKYGIQNFIFDIIEACSIELLDEREIYWIAHYNSYYNGYNRTKGGKSLRGEDHPRALVTKDQVWFIRLCYADHIPRRYVYEMIKEVSNITKRGFKKIWDNENWPDVHTDVYTEENYIWHKTIGLGHSEDQIGLSSFDRAIKQEEIDKWVEDYNSGISINALAKKYNRDNGTIEKYLANPKAIQEVKYKGRQLKNINTGKIFSSINSAAKWAHCGATTLTRHLATNQIAGTIPGTNEPAQWVELL